MWTQLSVLYGLASVRQRTDRFKHLAYATVNVKFAPIGAATSALSTLKSQSISLQKPAGFLHQSACTWGLNAPRANLSCCRQQLS
jgi:hypothetical protein